MFNSLSNWLKKRVDDIQGAFGVANNRQTFRTNVPVQQKAPPAQTFSRPQNQWQPARSVQQRQNTPQVVQQPRFNYNQSLQNNGIKTTQQLVNESYGKGLSGLGNRLKDVVDPNTRADEIRRQATSGLKESYDQQQARLTRNAVQSQGNKNALNQFASGGLSAATDFFGKGVGSLAQVIGRKNAAIEDIRNPILRTGVKVFAAPDTLLAGRKQADQIYSFGHGLSDRVENKKQQSGIGNRADDNKWAVGAGSVITQLPAQLATGGVGLVNMGAQTAAEEANKAQKAGRSNSTALGIGVLQGGANALSEKVGLDRLIPGDTNVTSGLVPYAKNILKNVLTEGGQEAQQQFTQNLIANKAYDPNQSLKEGVLEGAVLGGISGGVASAAVNAPNIRKQKASVNTDVTKPIKLRPNEAATMSDLQDVLMGNVKDPKTVTQIIKDARAAGQRTGLDVITGSPRDVMDRINAVLEQPQNSNSFLDKIKKSYTPLNEGGYIAGPKALDYLDAKLNGRVFEGVDGKPRFEVDDSGAKWIGKDWEANDLNKILDHPKLYEQYPELKNVLVDVTIKKDQLNPFGNGQFIDGDKPLIKVRAYDQEQAKEILLHEIQHYIQSKEGFAGGGVPNSKNATDIQQYQKFAGEAEARAVANRMNMSDGERYKSKLGQNTKSPQQVDRNTIRAVKAQIIDPKLEMWQKWYKDGDPSVLTDINKEVKANPILKDVGVTNLYEYYKTELGFNGSFEQFLESDIKLYRGGNTKRPNALASYTPFERKAKRFGDVSEITVKPKETYGMLGDFSEGEVLVPKSNPQSTFYDSLDVPKEDLIIRDGGGKAMSVEQNPADAIKAEAKRFGYDKGYTEEGQIANTIDELMKEQNAVREVGVPLLDKYQSQLDGTKTITDMMTPSELKAYKAAEVRSNKASKLLQDYFDYKKQGKAVVEPAKPKGLVVSEGKTPAGPTVQRVMTGKGKVEERVVPSKFPSIQEFDKMTGGDGTLQSQPNNQTVQRVPEFDARTGADAQPTARLDETIAKLADSPVLSEADLNTGRATHTGLTHGDKGLLRTVTDYAGSKLSPAGDGAVQRKIRRAGQYIFGKQFGQNKLMVKASQAFHGDATQTDAALLDIGKKLYSYIPDTASRERVHAVLDPETAKAGMNISEKNLTPNEQKAVQGLRQLGDAINDTSYRMGMISEKKWRSNKDGRYIARMYREVETAPDVTNLLDIPDSKTLFTGMYKSRQQFNEYLRQRILKDPVKLAVIRARQVRSNEALDDYMRQADLAGYVSDTPKKGYIKTEYNENLRSWNNKYVRQDVWENINGFKAMSKGINAINNVLDVYDGNPLRRMRKKLLTIWNPVVRTGNVTSNYFLAYLNGVNPLEYQTGKHWAQKALKNTNDPLVTAARKAGLTQGNIVRNDRNLFDANKEFMAGLDRESYNNTPFLQRAGQKTVELKDRASQRYGEADDIAKLAALKAKTDRGVPINKAIEEVRRGFQDYSRVGHLYDMGAKSPVFGNAFVRFQGDLYMHMLKNAAIDHPIRLAALPAATLIAGNALSALSGESEEDKKTRENRLGAPKLPFTNISTEFQTPWGAVDVARYTPLYVRNILNDNGGKGGIMDDLSRALPFNIPGNTTKEAFFKSMSSDPLIGPIIQLASDVDWKGKSIRDPEGVRDGKKLFPDNPLTDAEKGKNMLQYGLRSYLPYPFNEVGDIMASGNQNKRNEQAAAGSKYDPSKPGASFFERQGYNTSGSLKTTGQSIARLFGVRAQQYGHDQAQKARDDEKMFAYFDKVDAFKKTLDSTTQQQFDARHKSNQTRSGLQKELTEDPWYKYKNAGELLQNPKLFEAERKYAEMQNKYDGKPIDPIFNLPTYQRNTVLAKKLKLPGSKDEGFNTLYDQEWYQNFRREQDKYYAAKDQYKEAQGFADIKETNPYPEASADLQQAMDFYFSLPSGTGQRSAFIRNNLDTWNAITAQWDAQSAWTDKERAKLGLPAIARDDNSSGGYSSSGKRYSKSGRRSGGRTAVAKYKSGTSDSNKLSKQLQELANIGTKSSKSTGTPKKHTPKLKGVRTV